MTNVALQAGSLFLHIKKIGIKSKKRSCLGLSCGIIYLQWSPSSQTMIVVAAASPSLRLEISWKIVAILSESLLSVES